MQKFLLVALLLVSSGVRAADTVVVVLDASGSMDEIIPMRTGEKLEKMKVAKLALARTLLDLPENTQVGVLVFSAANLNSQEEWIYPISKINKIRLTDALQKPLPGGGTPLGEYVKKGADALLEQREKNKGYGTYTEVVVTDGVANDSDQVERNVPLVMARGIRLNVIGLAVAPDSFLASRVNSYQSANDIDTLTTAVKLAVAEVPAGKDGTIDPAWFDEIEPLPNDLAQASIVALNSTISQNQPIGEQPMSNNPVVFIPPDQQESPVQEGLTFFGQVAIFALIIIFCVIAIIIFVCG